MYHDGIVKQNQLQILDIQITTLLFLKQPLALDHIPKFGINFYYFFNRTKYLNLVCKFYFINL